MKARAVGRSGFVTIPRHLTEWEELDPYEFRLALWLSTHDSDYAERLSQREMARRLRIGQRKIADSLDRLEKLGVIGVERSGERQAVSVTFYREVWERCALPPTEAALPPTEEVAASHGGTEEEKKKEKEEERAIDGFEAFWRACPKRVDKAKARRAYLKPLKAGVLPETLLKAMEAYGESVKGSEPRFVAHPSTWLNGERWNDEVPSKGKVGAKTRIVKLVRQTENGLEEFEQAQIWDERDWSWTSVPDGQS